MAKPYNFSYSDRVKFSQGKQKEFILLVQDKTGIGIKELAKLINTSPRTLRDWRKEKFLMSYDSLKTLSKKAKIPIPLDIKIEKPFWYAKSGAKRGWQAVVKKYGRVPINEEYRKEKWREWWEKKGKFKPNLVTNKPLPVYKPKLSRELAEFTGIMMGDGGMTKWQFYVTLHRRDDLEFSYYVAGLINRLFKIKPSIIHIKKDSVVRILVSRSGLVKYLNSIGLVTGNKIKQQFDIPGWVKRDDSYLRACIRGLVDTDGCLIQHKYKVNGKLYTYKKLGFTTLSYPLQQTVLKTLNRWELKARVCTNNDIRIESVRNVEKYFKFIGSHNPKHLNKYYD